MVPRPPSTYTHNPYEGDIFGTATTRGAPPAAVSRLSTSRGGGHASVDSSSNIPSPPAAACDVPHFAHFPPGSALRSVRPTPPELMQGYSEASLPHSPGSSGENTPMASDTTGAGARGGRGSAWLSDVPVVVPPWAAIRHASPPMPPTRTPYQGATLPFDNADSSSRSALGSSGAMLPPAPVAPKLRTPAVLTSEQSFSLLETSQSVTDLSMLLTPTHQQQLSASSSRSAPQQFFRSVNAPLSGGTSQVASSPTVHPAATKSPPIKFKFALVDFRFNRRCLLAPFKVAAGDAVIVDLTPANDQSAVAVHVGVVAAVSDFPFPTPDAPRGEVPTNRILRHCREEDRATLFMQRRREHDAMQAARVALKSAKLPFRFDIKEIEFQFDERLLTVLVALEDPADSSGSNASRSSACEAMERVLTISFERPVRVLPHTTALPVKQPKVLRRGSGSAATASSQQE